MNETVNTLRYASRAKRIQNRPMIQMDPREEVCFDYKMTKIFNLSSDIAHYESEKRIKGHPD